MKPLLIASLSFALLTGNAFSQSAWFWQNPEPQGNYLRTFTGSPDGIIYTAGNNASMLRSFDGGAVWFSYRLSGATSNFRSVFFIDNVSGWAVGELGMVFKTSDGGATWGLQPSFTGHSLNSVHFRNESTGIIAASAFTIFRTTNKGRDWSVYSNASGILCKAYSLCHRQHTTSAVLRDS